MFRIACRDAGLECDYISEGKTTEELYKNIHQPIKEKHGHQEIQFPIVDYNRTISEIEAPWKEAFEESQKNKFKDIVEIAENKMK